VGAAWLGIPKSLRGVKVYAPTANGDLVIEYRAGLQVPLVQDVIPDQPSRFPVPGNGTNPSDGKVPCFIPCFLVVMVVLDEIPETKDKGL
jgi:hypothetical protein